MQAAATKTAGQELAAELRRYFKVGTRTRRYRNGNDLHTEMLDAIQTATTYPGCYSGNTDRVFRSAWAIYCAYSKHVGGYRIDGTLRRRITELTPYRFAGLLGRMVDAGVTNNFEGEMFFADMTREAQR